MGLLASLLRGPGLRHGSKGPQADPVAGPLIKTSEMFLAQTPAALALFAVAFCGIGGGVNEAVEELYAPGYSHG